MRLLVLLSLLGASVAAAGPKTVAVAAGDCGTLSDGMGRFEAALKQRLADDLWDAELVLSTVRPRAARSLEELKRQIDSARTLFYAGQADKALELVRQAISELERVSPKLSPFPVLADALMVQALVHRSANRKAELGESFRRVLRIDPAYQPDTNFFTPAFVQAFDAARKELQRGKKATLQVQSQPAGAEVFIDGQAVGKSPLRAALPPGEYTVSLADEQGVSFLHKVRLAAKEESLVVDLGYEAAVSARAPLCLAIADEAKAKAAATKLAAAIGAERYVLLRLVSKSGEPLRFGAVVVVGAEEERSGEVRQPDLANLAEFMVTGKSQPGLLVPGAPAAQAPEAREPKPTSTATPPSPSPAAASAPPRAVEPAPSLEPAPTAAPAPLAVTASAPPPRGLSAAGVVGVGLLATGGAVAVGGLVHFLVVTLPQHQKVAGLLDGSRLPRPSDATQLAAIQAAATAEAQARLVSFALLGAGAGTAAAGALLLALFPAARPVVAVTPVPQGAAWVLSGQW